MIEESRSIAMRFWVSPRYREYLDATGTHERRRQDTRLQGLPFDCRARHDNARGESHARKDAAK